MRGVYKQLVVPGGSSSTRSCGSVKIASDSASISADSIVSFLVGSSWFKWSQWNQEEHKYNHTFRYLKNEENYWNDDKRKS